MEKSSTAIPFAKIKNAWKKTARRGNGIFVPARDPSGAGPVKEKGSQPKSGEADLKDPSQTTSDVERKN